YHLALLCVRGEHGRFLRRWIPPAPRLDRGRTRLARGARLADVATVYIGVFPRSHPERRAAHFRPPPAPPVSRPDRRQGLARPRQQFLLRSRLPGGLSENAGLRRRLPAGRTLPNRRRLVADVVQVWSGSLFAARTTRLHLHWPRHRSDAPRMLRVGS